MFGKDAAQRPMVVPIGPIDPYGRWTQEDDDIDNGRLVALKAISEEVAHGQHTAQDAHQIGMNGKINSTYAGLTDTTSGSTGGEQVNDGSTKTSTAQYEDQNAKWYKAAKKAEKKSGAPNVHLAL